MYYPVVFQGPPPGTISCGVSIPPSGDLGWDPSSLASSKIFYRIAEVKDWTCHAKVGMEGRWNPHGRFPRAAGHDGWFFFVLGFGRKSWVLEKKQRRDSVVFLGFWDGKLWFPSIVWVVLYIEDTLLDCIYCIWTMYIYIYIILSYILVCVWVLMLLGGRATGHKHDTYKDLHLVLGVPFP